MINLDGEVIEAETPLASTPASSRKMNPFEFVKAIQHTKEPLMDQEDYARSYNPYLVNRGLSFAVDCVLFANIMNQYAFLDKDVQFTFLINTVRARKRYTRWIKKVNVDHVELIKQQYNYSTEKALQVLPLLSEGQVMAISKRLRTGGLKNGDNADP